MNVVCFNAEKFYRIAYDYFQYENNTKLAKKYINLALKDNPKHFKSLVLKGRIFILENKIQNAAKTLLSALKINDNEVNCLYYLAYAYSLEEKTTLAIKYLDKIFDQNPLDKEFLSDCYKLKISILVNLKQYKKAENILKNLNYSLYSNDIFNIEESFYKIIQNKKPPENKAERRILHINF